MKSESGSASSYQPQQQELENIVESSGINDNINVNSMDLEKIIEDKLVATKSMKNKMKNELYIATDEGDVESFYQLLSDDPECGNSLEHQSTPQGNTVLHIAVFSGNIALVECILRVCPQLIGIQNVEGDFPLHVAASAGNLSIVRILVEAEQQQYPATSTSSSLTWKKNLKGYTALHSALENRSAEVAHYLFETDPSLISSPQDSPNKLSPLYMAIEAGYSELFKLMIQTLSENDQAGNERLKQRLIEIAILKKNGGVLDVILEKWPSLVAPPDEESLQINPLSVAVSAGYVEGVRKILEKSTELAYVPQNGFYPIHLASGRGHVQIIQDLLKHRSDSLELLTQNKRNILHEAAKNGRAEAVSYMLKNPKLQALINQTDSDGNTPLHLASEAGHPKVVSDLTLDSRVDLQLLNKQGRTALDVVDVNGGVVPSLRKRMTWIALKHAGASSSSNTQSSTTLSASSVEAYKDRVNTLLLVATLVATIAYASGVTVPNNLSSKLLHKSMFYIFSISNTIAMYTSILAAIVLIWSHLGHNALVRASLDCGVPLLGLSVFMISVAFLAGVYLVVNANNVIAVFILVIGSIGIFSVMVTFAPLYPPKTFLRYGILRFMFYYPFNLVMKATKCDKVED